MRRLEKRSAHGRPASTLAASVVLPPALGVALCVREPAFWL